MPKQKEKKGKKSELWFEPAKQMENLINMEEDIHDMMRQFLRMPFWHGIDIKEAPPSKVIPVRFSENEKDELVAKADLPGFSKDEIRLKVTENSIEISAEKKKQVVQREKNFFRQERSYGSMQRVMPLPYVVKPEESRAKFENELLVVTMPKAERKKVREIKPE